MREVADVVVPSFGVAVVAAWQVPCLRLHSRLAWPHGLHPACSIARLLGLEACLHTIPGLLACMFACSVEFGINSQRPYDRQLLRGTRRSTFSNMFLKIGLQTNSHVSFLGIAKCAKKTAFIAVWELNMIEKKRLFHMIEKHAFWELNMC